MLAALVAPGAELSFLQPSSPACRYQARCQPPLTTGAVAAGPDHRDELVAAIRALEGEALERPPMLFKATVALGSAMLAGAGLLLLGIAG